MYIVKKRCMPSGNCRLKRTTNHPLTATNTTPTVHSASQMRWGMARKKRKKTVSRLRLRSSITRTRTGGLAVPGSGTVVKSLPQVERRQRAVWPPRFGYLLHFRRLRQFLQPVVDLHRLANAEVADRQDVRSPEVEHQEHVDGQAAKALDGRERLRDLRVRQLGEIVDRKLAVHDVLREIAQVRGLCP